MAATAKLGWDFDVANEPNIDSFRIKVGTTSGNYTSLVSVADKTLREYTMTGTNGTTYFAVIVSLSGGIESASSNEVSFVPTIPAPTNLVVL